ncbi:DUF2345 domain-containing protein, partial [Variovorax sp. GB1P17]|uniref:DUF2345 domain-containing protein n=1 Tax=Variovorax sp. GB1P17 TaxID=3443740 RepID=UPI003F485900
AGRKDPRGEGFELRTDGHGVLRAQDGMLITTEARPEAARHAKDMGETVQRLTQARDQIEGLAEASQAAKVQDKQDDQSVVAQAIKQQNDALAGKGSDKAEGKYPELNAPHLVFASPTGIAATATESLHGHTGAHVQFTSGGHASISAAKRILASVAEGVRVFALQRGIKAFASEGDIRIEAQSDALEATALKELFDKIGAGKKPDTALLLTGDLIDFNRNIDPAQVPDGIGEQWKKFNVLNNVNTPGLYPRGQDDMLAFSLVRYAYNELLLPVFMTSGNHEAYSVPYGISPRLNEWAASMGVMEDTTSALGDSYGRERPFTATRTIRAPRGGTQQQVRTVGPEADVGRRLVNKNKNLDIKDLETSYRNFDGASKWSGNMPNEGISADHNMTIYEATLAYGPTYAQALTGNNYKVDKSLIVRNSQIYGNGKKIFEAYAGGIQSIEIDTVIFGGGLSTEPVTVAGGTGADLKNVRTRVNDGIVIRSSKVPRLSVHHINTSLLQLQGCELDSLDLSSGRIANLQISGNTIARSVDFTNTQVKESSVQGLAKDQAKLEGSNIKLN